jgi:hypothetical protein
MAGVRCIETTHFEISVIAEISELTGLARIISVATFGKSSV